MKDARPQPHSLAPKRGASAAELKRIRLAEALRKNLQRRKQSAAPPPPGADTATS